MLQRNHTPKSLHSLRRNNRPGKLAQLRRGNTELITRHHRPNARRCTGKDHITWIQPPGATDNGNQTGNQYLFYKFLRTRSSVLTLGEFAAQVIAVEPHFFEGHRFEAGYFVEGLGIFLEREILMSHIDKAGISIG